MSRPLSRLLLLAVLAAAASAQPEGSRGLEVEAGPRVALVIGNATYEHATALQNPANDVEDVSGALEAAGFAVHAHTDLTYGEMGQALADFADDAVGADVALFFYAGHGVQVEGDNFLVPIDADVVTEAQMRYRSIALGEVLSTLDDSEARLKLVFLDACRDNPFRSWRSSAGGWASTQGPSGSVISFATAQGERASDNMSGRNGLFTEAFLEEFYTPGLELTQLLRNVRQRVREASDFEQEPWTSMSYDGDFFFVPAGTTLERPAAGLDARVAEAIRLRDTDGAASAAVLAEAAAAGHAEAQSVLGWMRLRGDGVPADPASGLDLLRAAVAQGHAAAQTNLGFAYETGLGVAQDVPEAVRLYRLAAGQGRAAAQNNLGSLYERGLGVVADLGEAARLYALAAAQEHAPAQANLGVLTEAGRGVPADAARAADLYERAALAGHAGAMVRLGVLLHDGRGVAADPSAARRWLQRAADLGQPLAPALLAAMD